MDRSRPIILSADLSELAGGGSGARRERAATALEKALDFVDAQGSELSKLRARVVLQSREPREAVDAILEMQLEGGGFEPPTDRSFAGASSDPAGRGEDRVTASLEVLTLLGGLRGLHAPGIDPTIRFLSSEQGEDGTWHSEGSAHPDHRVFLTGMLGGYLGRTRTVRPHVLDRAAAFLEGEWAPDRVEGGSWAALAGFAHFYTNVPNDLADEALQWCGRELERGFRNRSIDAAAALRVMQYCDADALPGLKIETEELLDLLLAEQAADGGFATACLGEEAKRRSRVCVTIESMRSVISLCANLAD